MTLFRHELISNAKESRLGRFTYLILTSVCVLCHKDGQDGRGKILLEDPVLR